MLVKSGDKTKPINSLRDYYIKINKANNFSATGISPSNNIFKENKILKISDYIELETKQL